MLPISKEGYENLKIKIAKVREEYETLPAIIATARAKGDLKENADYHAARERQGMLKAEIDKLSGDLTQSQVIDPAALPAGTVTFGKKVSVTDLETNQEVTYHLVGPAESAPEENKIAVTSQLARGFLGKKTDDIVAVIVPAGTRNFKINSISL